MVKLDSVRLVMPQFSFSNPSIVPESVKNPTQETEAQHQVRKNRATGTLVIPPTELCRVSGFITGLELEGFELVDAVHQERVDQKDPSKTFQMIRFVFARSELANPSPEFKQKRDEIHADLELLTRLALWRVRAFLNPFYRNGAGVEGAHTLSINLESRVPLRQPDGRMNLVKARFKLRAYKGTVNLLQL